MNKEIHNGNHDLVLGYLIWLFGFTGSHRFFYGRPITGTIWFFTLGLLGIGWIIDAFLLPGMDRDSNRRYIPGRIDYNVAWLLLTFLGVLGVHRMFIGKWVTGILWLLTGGLLTLGYIYDYWTWNEQISRVNQTPQT